MSNACDGARRGEHRYTYRLWHARLFHFHAALELQLDRPGNGDKADRFGCDEAARVHPASHEIQCRACWPAIKKWCWEPTGRNSLIADKCDVHETARGVRLKFEQRANFISAQIIAHRVEHRTTTAERPAPKGFASRYRIGSWTSNLKFQITKIGQE